MYKDTPMTVSLIPLTKLHEFKNHPYKVIDDADMEALAESVSRHGILSPLLVRRLGDDGDEYEIISGHRRAKAAEKAGLTSVPAFVVDMSRDEATIALVDANLHRENILPSEKAFAYKMKLEAMKHQGQRTDLTCAPVGHKTSRELLSEQTGDSHSQIQRYIRLTHLVPELLSMVDEGRIAMRPAVELSFLTEEEQYYLLDAMEQYDCTPSHAQAIRIKNLSREGVLYRHMIGKIMEEDKPNQKAKIHLDWEEFSRFFPSSYTDTQIKRDIQKGLELLKRQRMRDRDAR